VDVQALTRLAKRVQPIQRLAAEINATLTSGGRLFLVGCGATGRLSLALETFARQGLLAPAYADRVVGFMAGGDAALIRSIENFEDHPEYGARQLTELGFQPNDLLIASTEGGETPFVIGATEEAVRLGARPPFFLYCNPDALLCWTAERSRRVIQHPGIATINLSTGPMAVAGSTRMQASTVLMAAIGVAMECHTRPASVPRVLSRLCQRLSAHNPVWLEPFITSETNLYQKDGYMLYRTRSAGIAVLTDTTERSPTFSLPPFENAFHPEQPACRCYLHLCNTPDAPAAWRTLLGREPRCLEWPEHRHFTGAAHLKGFNFSDQTSSLRQARTGKRSRVFHIELSDACLTFRLGRLHHNVACRGWSLLEKQCLLKMLLNDHSTLVMGRLGRYQGNLMTYVKPANYKLIDRAVRYVRLLWAAKHTTPLPYAAATRALFEVKQDLPPDQPIVPATLRWLETHPLPA
jgi:N-acetylmuramic acid 6-phosphate etherase